MESNWISVDRVGLAATLERRGKTWAILELIQNALDATGTKKVTVNLDPAAGKPLVVVNVQDDSPEGWDNLANAYTMFGRSRRAADANKRGRFCAGEKMVLALCQSATIATMNGTVHFNADGTRSMSRTALQVGTCFNATMRMTRTELQQVEAELSLVIPPQGVTILVNGTMLLRSQPVDSFIVNLPTELANAEGTMYRTRRDTLVEVFESSDSQGDVLEMGIPVCSLDMPYRVNVMQKVPMGMDRDAVTDAFRKAVQVAVLNHMNQRLSAEDMTRPWVQEAMEDSRVQPEAVKAVITKRFGERAVVATVGDPIANATAEAQGYSVVHGGSMSAAAWANVRKAGAMQASAQVFPTPSAAQRAAANPQPGACPLCGQPVPK